MEDCRSARTQLEASISLEPNLSVAYDFLCTVYTCLGLLDQSKKAYEHFKAIKNLAGEDSPDPTASVVSSEESATPQSGPKPQSHTLGASPHPIEIA